MPATATSKIIGPALLLWPQLLIVGAGVNLELNLVCVDDLLTTILALYRVISFSLRSGGMVKRLVFTIDVGLGALTGKPLALTGARVPAASAFFCSLLRWKVRH